jgi:predicted PurR-regulated permease PerM
MNYKLKKKRSLIRDNHASLAFAIAFFFLAAILIFFFAVGIPMLININVEFYAAGEDVLDSSLNVIDTIQDSSVKSQLQSSVQAAKDATTDNVDILSFFFQYGWIFLIVIVAMVMFMKARQSIETDVI